MTDRRERPHPVPFGFLAAVLAIAAIEGFVSVHKDDLFLRVQSWTWREAGRSARRDAPKADILCIGDSQIQQGVAAPILHDRLGLRTQILAIGGGQAPASYFLLRRALRDPSSRPKAILVDFYPRLLELGPDYNRAHWPGFLSPAECLDLAWTSRDPDLLATLLAAKLFPSVDYRREIRANLRSALAGENRWLEHNVPSQLRRNLARNQGGVIMPRHEFAADGLEEEARPWNCHPVNASYLVRFLELASASGVPVFWLLPPVCPDQRLSFDRRGFNAHLDRFVREMAGPMANVTILDARQTCKRSSCFVDPRHLCRDGAIELSWTIAEVLRSTPKPGPGRTIVLEPDSAVPVNLALEDLDRSKAIIAARRARR
jgi:hypothetical protein